MAGDKQIDKGNINEFSTDLDNPPLFRKNDKPFPEEFKAAIRKEFPEIQPAVISGKSLEEVFSKACDAAENMARWEITHQEDAEGCIEGVYTSLVMRTKEDFTIHVTKGSGEDEVIVNMRTRSQSKGGMDGNERIMAFLNELQEELKD